MQKVKQTAPGTFLVWDEPLPIGKTYASGVAVHLFSKLGEDAWKCDARECMNRRYYVAFGGPPKKDWKPLCEHILAVKQWQRAN